MSVYRIAQILNVDDIAGLPEMVEKGLVTREQRKSGLWHGVPTEKGLKLIADVDKLVREARSV